MQAATLLAIDKEKDDIQIFLRLSDQAQAKLDADYSLTYGYCLQAIKARANQNDINKITQTQSSIAIQPTSQEASNRIYKLAVQIQTLTNAQLIDQAEKQFQYVVYNVTDQLLTCDVNKNLIREEATYQARVPPISIIRTSPRQAIDRISTQIIAFIVQPYKAFRLFNSLITAKLCQLKKLVIQCDKCQDFYPQHTYTKLA